MFAELPVEQFAQSPFFWVCAVASLFGLTVWYLYGGFIEENYTKIKWFRRLLLPHLSPVLQNIDDSTEDIDLSRLYVETPIYDEELALEVDVPSEDYDDVMDSLGDFFLESGFRPEVLLASLGNREGEEVGNWVLTAPERNHTDMTFVNRFHEILLMATAKRQLHVRIFYEEQEEKLGFYVHWEYNAYSPLYAKRHFNGKDVSISKAKALFEDYRQELTGGILNNYQDEANDN